MEVEVVMNIRGKVLLGLINLPPKTIVAREGGHELRERFTIEARTRLEATRILNRGFKETFPDGFPADYFNVGSAYPFWANFAKIERGLPYLRTRVLEVKYR